MRITFALAIALTITSFGAGAEPSKCLIEVDGKAYTFGRCNADRERDGGLSVGTGETKRSPIFAIISPNDDGTAAGYWNEQPQASHAQTPLGVMKKSGGCWLNERAKVCAWPEANKASGVGMMNTRP